MRAWGAVRGGTTIALCTAGLMLGIPFCLSEPLRLTYQQTFANWLAKVRRPDRVFIGDSITASGGAFGRPDTINLASNGLTTLHVAAIMERAKALNPRAIFVMAGTNDAVAGDIDPVRLRGLWQTMLADRRVVVTLAPHSRDPV